MAKTNIPTKKAFLFIPYEIIITPQKAKESKLKKMINAYPRIFRDSSDSMDAILWIYLMHEKFKGEASFFHHYFEAIGNAEIVLDWTDEDLEDLQDIFLTLKAKKSYKSIENYYKFIEPALDKFSKYFPVEP